MKSFDRLIRVMKRLRGPQGCPWDKKQTHESLLRYLFEEAQEVKASIRKKDWPNFEEELGDILLQVIFHAQMAQEKGLFSIEDVIKTLIRKLTLRHPHVFGFTTAHKKLLKKGQKFATAQDVIASWDTLKKISLRRKPVKSR